MAMVPEIKKEWQRRLLSGDYTQGIGSLCLIREDHATEHCCLGVLCEMAVESGVAVKTTETWKIRFGSAECPAADQSATSLPHSVVKWSGLPSPTGYYKKDETLNGGSGGNLAWLNDSGTGFEEIANVYIEKYF